MRYSAKETHKNLYSPGTKEFVLVEVPPMRYLAIDGHGDPNTSERYAEAVPALYTSAYAVRAELKKRTGDDFVVGPLEGLWSAPDPTAFAEGRKDEWDWTMLIPIPEPVTDGDIEAGLAASSSKKPELPIHDVRVLELEEGPSLQIMHVGPYAEEGPVLARLHHEVMPEGGYTFGGDHHEIYLGDPRKSAPEKLRTILRQPVVPA
ncbi:MAG: GyrI-like domain-containing protein [bacterium]|nr:GyrI-like domain-containing protein [bacterium]